MKILSVFVLSFALLAPGAANAVDGVSAGDGKVAMGFQGGITVPEYKVTNSSISNTWERKDGWVGGIFFEFGIWAVTLRPEVSYVRQGYTIANVAEVHNSYLELNALLKFNPFGAGVVSPFIVLGPQWNKQIATDVTPVAGSTVVYSSSSNAWDLAAVGGLGVEFNVSEFVALGIQGRYIYGFRDIDESTTEVKQRAFQALANVTIQNAF